MAAQIKVLVADDIQATRENIKKLVEFHSDITIVGEASNAEEAIERIKLFQPDVVLMDINMPGMDGISATSVISNEMPNTSIIIMSVQGEQEYLRKAMVAGAKDFLIKPFTGDELMQAVKEVYNNCQKRRKVVPLEAKPAEPGKIITIFSTKGGVGKTTIATNLAVALAANTGNRVGLLDADLQFGDVALFLNVLPRATIADLVREDNLDEKVVESYLTTYNDVRLLAAPLRPEQGETVTPQHLTSILKTMRSMYKYTVVDTFPAFSEAMLAVLDISDIVLVVSALDLPTIKNVKLCLEIMDSLEYPAGKIRPILNRASSEGGMDVREAEESLRCSFAGVLPSDGKTVVTAVNRGVPFVSSNPETPISQIIVALAKNIASGEWQDKADGKSVVSKLRRLFG